MSWQSKVEQKRKQLRSKIPVEWLLDEETLVSLKNDKKHLFTNLDKLCTSEENEITHATILKLRDRLARGEVTCHDVAYAFCHRAALAHQVINCLSEIMFSCALLRAKELDTHRPEVLPPLYGIPISVKDQCNVENVDTTLGYLGRAFKPKKSHEESLIIKQLKDQGAILYVKTTVPSSMMATDTVSNTFGVTLNGLNQCFSPGGSSGGEGALIAAGGSLLGLGTDIGGSIRIPSAYHGLYGLKPTHGRLPYLNVDNSFEGRELIPSVIGPLAKDLEDLKFFMEVMVNVCKPWIDDVKCTPYNFDSKSNELHKDYVVGIWYGDGVITPPPSDLRALKMCEEIITKCPGIKAVKWEPPVELNKELHDVAMETDIADAGYEINAEFEATGEPLLDILKPMVLAKGSSACSVNNWWALNKRAYEAKTAYRKYLNSFAPTERPDVIISPLTLTPFRPGEMLSTTLRYVLFVNVLNFPSLAVPITKVDTRIDGKADVSKMLNDEDKMVAEYWNDLLESEVIQDFPVSLQIMSPTYDDNEVCKFGSWLMQHLGHKESLNNM